MENQKINKIVYFDKETIRNILQEYNHGEKTQKNDSIQSTQIQSSIGVESSAKIKLNIPFFSRFEFLFTGKIDASYLNKTDNSTSISSTEISEFDKLKSFLTEISNVQLSDIENSSTSLRVAGGYLRIVKGDIEGLDTKEFKAVMDNYDGYDTYSIDENRYVRFNNNAFVSNYKRNDLLTTTMTLYCIPVGEFKRERFDYVKEISKMERLFSYTEKPKTLADIYSPDEQNKSFNSSNHIPDKSDIVTLYDVLYACVTTEVHNGK